MDREIDGWAIDDDGVATFSGDKAVTAWVSGDILFVNDATRYYPGGDYQISLDVIRAMKNPEEAPL